MRAYLSLGSNIGDRIDNLSQARNVISEHFEIIAESSLYETEPWGYEDQPQFLNQVIEVNVQLSPEEFLKAVKEIENELGREKTFKYGPRNIDIDIVTYGNLVYRSDKLKIPHPHFDQRAFVVVPLQEISPNFRHPITNKDIDSIIESVSTDGVYIFSS
jgi:2-amino-4-hydroxy-6-hydroxymethyldihydropteridine diphosphokinase